MQDLSFSPSPAPMGLPIRRIWLATAGAFAVLLLWDASGLDMAVMSALGDASGFDLRHQWWLEQVLHDAARNLGLVLYGLVLLMVVAPLGWFRGLSRWQRLEAWVGMSLALLAVSARAF